MENQISRGGGGAGGGGQNKRSDGNFDKIEKEGIFKRNPILKNALPDFIIK